MEQKKLLTVKEAAELRGMNEQHLRKLCRLKKVAHERMGNRYLFTVEDAEKLNAVVHVEPDVELPKNRIPDVEI